MCGLIGFFVGCDLAVACPKRNICSTSKSYRSSFKNWDTRASVRSGPQRVNEVKSTLFPERFVPVLSHRLVQQLDNKSRELLQEAALYRFLNFTHKLELLVVNTVTANIALGRYNTDFSNEIRLDAHRIYTDEAYHALFSFELMQKIKERNISCSAFNEDIPAFVRRTQNIVMQHDSNGRALLELLTVIVSEMLITSTLREATNVPDLDHGVSAMITDHAKDEARHHAFYKQVLLDLWPRLSDRNRSLALTHIHSLLMAYTAPDNDAIANELQAVGLTIDQAHQVIAETYDPRSVSEYAIACGGTILSTFEELTNPLEFGLLSEQFSTEYSLEGSF